MPRMPQKILAEKGINQRITKLIFTNQNPLTDKIGKWVFHTFRICPYNVTSGQTLYSPKKENYNGQIQQHLYG